LLSKKNFFFKTKLTLSEPLSISRINKNGINSKDFHELKNIEKYFMEILGKDMYP